MGYKDKEGRRRLKDERYAEFEKDCQSLIECEAHTLELRSREESYQKGYADGMKEAIRMAERMVKE